SSGLEKFRISETEGNFDDKVIEKIEQFIPYRNEALEIFLAIAQYSNTSEFHHQIHRFFEQLIYYLGPPKEVSRWTEWDFDNFRFLIEELFLYCVASFLKYERFDGLAYLLRQRYYLEKEAD